MEKAAADLGVEVVTQIPPTWGVEAQTPILDALIARGDLDYIITAPVEKDQMVGPLQAAVDAGIKIITVDTFLGDGDYANGPVTFPISYIGSDNVEGGRISARGLAEAIGGKGKVYINSTNPNVSSVQGREQGFAEVMENEFPDITVLGPDYNLDDAANAPRSRPPPSSSASPTSPASSAPTCSAPRAPARRWSTPASAATSRSSPTTPPRTRSSSMNQGVVSLVLAQKPFDMGYMAVQFAVADAAGVTSLPQARARPASRSSTRTTSPTPRSRASSTRCPAADRRHRTSGAPAGRSLTSPSDMKATE